MGARGKLNAVYCLGCLFVASIVGAIGQSWLMFWLAFIAAIAVCYEGGGIRSRSNRRTRRGP